MSRPEAGAGPEAVVRPECDLCFHHCKLQEGDTGFCRARKNIEGKIVGINYGKITSLALDPIEKKPLKNFHPGSLILSCGSFGCNLSCSFCQNNGISFASENDASFQIMNPEALVEKAVALIPRGNIGLAYTYNEPLMSYEFLMDTMPLARKMGLLNVLVTNGTVEEAPLLEILKYTDAMNIDLKGFSEEFYKKVGGDFASVKRTIELASNCCHVELTTLIIPGENDSREEMEKEAAWIASINPKIPLHISRFFPRHRMGDSAPTPVETIHNLVRIARMHLEYVYPGNC